jgi:hypothetical protein
MAKRKTVKKEVITTEALEAARAVSDFLLLSELKRRCDESDAFRTLMTEAVKDRLLLSDAQLRAVCENRDAKLYDENEAARDIEIAILNSEPVALAARVIYDNDAAASDELRYWLQHHANAFGSHAVLL